MAVKVSDICQRAWLDSFFYFDDLWNSCAYRHVSTVYAPSVMQFKPRRQYSDPDPGSKPLEERYPAAVHEQTMASVKNLLFDCCVKQGDGHWVENGRSNAWALFEQSARACYPEALHGQTLVVVLYHSRFYINGLRADEQHRLTKIAEISVRKLESYGYGSFEAGRDYTPSDYADFQHLSESGGEKLARAVAEKVNTMARRLNYIE
jgi:hypothetical protein